MFNTVKTTWRKVRLSEIINLYSGGTPSRSQQSYWHGDIKWLAIPDVAGADGGFVYDSSEKITEAGLKNSPARIVPKDTIIISARGTVGKLAMLNEPMAFNQSCYGITTKDEKFLGQKYLFYALKNVVRSAKRLAHGGVFDTFTTSTFDHIDIIVPMSVDEQNRIVEILSVFDEKIENNNRIIKILEEMAQIILKERFLTSTKGNTKNAKLSELVKIISGHPFSSSLYTNDKNTFGVVTIKNVQDGRFVTDCDSFIREEDIPKNTNKECTLDDGDILLSLTGNVGRACFVYGGQYLLNQRVAKLKPRKEKDKAFVYFLFRSVAMQNQLINMAKGSAQPNLSPVETEAIELELPSRQELDRYSEVATPWFQQLVEKALENKKLAAMRDLLLSKLMSGEIRV